MLQPNILMIKTYKKGTIFNATEFTSRTVDTESNNIQDIQDRNVKRQRHPCQVSEAWREAHPQLEQRHKERRKHQDHSGRNEITAVLRFFNWNMWKYVEVFSAQQLDGGGG